MFSNISLTWKIVLPITVLLSLLYASTIMTAQSRIRNILFEEVKNSSLKGYKDTVLNALTTMMITGSIKEGKELFTEQMQHIIDMKIIRSKALVDQFGRGTDNYDSASQLEKEVLQRGKPEVILDGAHVVGVFPYIARSNSMGKNCLMCHNVKESEVLGAISIRLSIMDSLKASSKLQALLIYIAFFGVLLTSFLIFVIVKKAHNPILVLTDKIKAIANGDLTVEIRADYHDEIGNFAQHMKKMVDSLRNIVNNIALSTNDVITTLNLLNGSIDHSSKDLKEQYFQVTTISSAADKMINTIMKISENSSVTKESSTNAINVAKEGSELSKRAIDSVGHVKKSTLALSTVIKNLKDRVNEIGDIVTLINEIADQTNLLSLNAAIESARAGEAGKGFAIVASEIKGLSEKTLNATQKISQKINALHNEAEATVVSMKKASETVDEANKNIYEIGDKIKYIVDATSNNYEHANLISDAVSRHTSSSLDISLNIHRTLEISNQVNELSIEISNEINSLNEVVKKLNESVHGFKADSID